MNARPRLVGLLCLGLLAGCASLGAPTALAGAVANLKSGDAKGLVIYSFRLKGSNGYHIEGIFARAPGGSHAPIAQINASRQALTATYAVDARRGPGVRATFGNLGKLSLGFHSKKRSVEGAGSRCVSISETGVLRGSLRFTGELGYTEVQATSAAGRVLRFPDGLCFLDDKAGSSSLPPLPEEPHLVARSRIANGTIEVAATQSFGPDAFLMTATVSEKVGEMKISRKAVAVGFHNTLAFGPGDPPRSADLQPPSPFTGSAHFEDPTSGPPTWAGTLGVSLPGAPEVALAGPEFAARACLHSTLLSGCTVKIPASPGRPQPEL